MIEKIVSALRKSFRLVFFRNIWLLWVALAYSFLSVFFMLGSTAVPVIYWVLAGRDFEPGLLFTNPLEFIIEYRLLIIYAALAYTVGFILFLVIWLFYHAGLTAVVTRAVDGFQADGDGKVAPGMFLKEGRRFMTRSTGTAALAGLLPLPPLVVLLAVAVVLLVRAAIDPGIFMPPLSGGIVLLLLAGVISLLATALLVALAWLWYRFALCAVCADDLTVAKAMQASLRFFRRCWHGVLGLVLANILLGMVISGLSMSVSFGIKALGGFNPVLEILLAFPATIASMAISLGFGLWMKSVLVVFYLDTREPPDNLLQSKEL